MPLFNNELLNLGIIMLIASSIEHSVKPFSIQLYFPTVVETQN